MSKSLSKLALLVLSLCLPLSWAEPMGYKTLRVGHFPTVEYIIPQTVSADRMYVRTKMPTHVTKAQLQVDEQSLIQSIGTAQSTSIPSELVQGYQKRYSDIQVFPLAPLKEAKGQIQLGWILENSQQKSQSLSGKQLQDLLHSFP